eukprot:scaffold735_cov376-Prasinococcus_capsulatus_cf.AAC.15
MHTKGWPEGVATRTEAKASEALTHQRSSESMASRIRQGLPYWSSSMLGFDMSTLPSSVFMPMVSMQQPASFTAWPSSSSICISDFIPLGHMARPVPAFCFSSVARSNTLTSQPAFRSAIAAASPLMPAPTIVAVFARELLSTLATTASLEQHILLEQLGRGAARRGFSCRTPAAPQRRSWPCALSSQASGAGRHKTLGILAEARALRYARTTYYHAPATTRLLKCGDAQIRSSPNRRQRASWYTTSRAARTHAPRTASAPACRSELCVLPAPVPTRLSPAAAGGRSGRRRRARPRPRGLAPPSRGASQTTQAVLHNCAWAARRRRGTARDHPTNHGGRSGSRE